MVRLLQENIDYEINYDLGTLRSSTSNHQCRFTGAGSIMKTTPHLVCSNETYMGLRLDYLANKNSELGCIRWFVWVNVHSLQNKIMVTIPSGTTMYGLDFDYRNEIPRVTKWLNKLPFYSTTASVSYYGLW